MATYVMNADGEHTRTDDTSQAGTKPRGRIVGRVGARDRTSDYQRAERVVALWRRPLAHSAGHFWSFGESDGWTVCDSLLFSLAAKVSGRNPANSIMPILQNQLALPSGDSQESSYWVRTGDAWTPGWAPLKVTGEQVVFTDQILNVVTGESEWLQGRIVYGPSVTLPYALEEGADEPRCQEFEEMVSRALGGRAEVIRHFQEVWATILQPHVPLRGQIIMWGLPYTGKTTIATAMGCAPAGRGGIAQVQESQLVRDKWITAALVNRFVCISDDSAMTSGFTTFLKNYTSGIMVVEPKFHQPCSVTPTAKLASTSNEIQHLADASGAAQDRMYAFRMDNPLPKVHGSLSSTKMLVSYWSEPSRRAGVLSWLMEGLVRLRQRGQFAPPAEWLDEQASVHAEADPVAAALREALEADPEGFVPATLVLEALEADAGDHKALSMSLPTYMLRLFGARKIRRWEDTAYVRGYVGVRVKM